MIFMLVTIVAIGGGTVEDSKLYTYDTMDECNQRVIHFAEKFDGAITINDGAFATRHKIPGTFKDVYRACHDGVDAR